jgi:kynurenine formamidase
MRIRSFIIAYALVLAIILFADRRHAPLPSNRFSHVIDLTGAPNSASLNAQPQRSARQTSAPSDLHTTIVVPDTLIPGTWTAAQIPAERLIAPLVVLDLKPADVQTSALNSADHNVSSPSASQISLDDIAAWESQHGAIPQGAIVAIRHASGPFSQLATIPITNDAAQFLMDARYTTGFAIETPADFGADRTLARQIALHGNYVVEGTARLTTIPAIGSLIIVAPAKTKGSGRTAVRVLAMVK